MTRNKEIVAVFALAFSSLLIAWKHHDRKKLKNQSGRPQPKELSIINITLDVLFRSNDFYSYMTEKYEELNTLTMRVNRIISPHHIVTVDPQNIEHILKDNFEGYAKGTNFDTHARDLFGNGIINTDGESWKFQRKTTSRIFYVKNFRDYFTKAFVGEADITSREVFDKAAESGQVIDLHDIMLKYTIDSFTEIAFGVKLNSVIKQTDFARSLDSAQSYVFKRLTIPYYHQFWTVFSFFQHPNKQSLDVINSFAVDIIHNRRKSPKLENMSKDDLLSLFMRATNLHAKQPSDTELRDIAVNFIVAGRDTTAQTLSWMFYMLLKHPEVEEKMYQEAVQYIEDDIESDPQRLYETIQDKIVYSHAVLNETMRLYPAIPVGQKEAIGDDILPDGTVVKKGDVIHWQPYCQGRMVSIWGEDAKEFKPERWLKNDSLIHVTSSQWSVFSSGPRMCLGKHLAIVETLVAMLLIIKKYKFHHAPGHKVKIRSQVTLCMKSGLHVTVEKRNS